LRDLVRQVLDDMKASNIQVLDVHQKTSITDSMVIASGNSRRHLRNMAEEVALKSKQGGHPVLGLEGDKDADWVLLDLGDVIVHIMLPVARDFYNLEKLWAPGLGEESQSAHGVS